MRRRVVVRLNGVAFSRRVDVRIAATLVVAVAVALAAAGLAMTLGDYHVPIGQVYRSLVGQAPARYQLVVVDFRLPRVLAALLAGGALGLAGAIFQSFARNPLVSPDIIGVNSGSALAAVAMLTSFGVGASLVPVGAFVGALAAACVVYATARVRGLSPYRLVLIGIGVDAFCRAGVSYFLIKGNINEVTSATLWMIGSLANVTMGSVWFLLVAGAVLVPAAMALRRPLENLQLGDDTARALGTRAELARFAVLVVGVLLAASAVAVCGPVAFVAFIAPHVARSLSRAPGPAVFPAAAAVGALLLLLSDLVAQHAFGIFLPLGVITPILGGPYFLVLLLRLNRRQEVG